MKIRLSLLLFNLSFTVISVANVVESALSAVVTVAVEQTQPIGKVIFGFRGGIADQTYAESLKLSNALGSGSGFAIQMNGELFVVTNAHVVESANDEPGSLFVYSYLRNKYEMSILGGDSFYDVAVLKFVDKPGDEFSYLEFANETPEIAERVYAIGNPLGEYPYTVTDGIISALNRVRGGLTGKFGYIQSTATTIWGNSGGPLINEEGKVVGINSQIGFATGPDGNTYLQQQLNFALEPILSQKIVSQIVEKGTYQRAYLGVQLSQSYEVGRSPNGQFIGRSLCDKPILSGVLPDSPAHLSLNELVGWEILKINNSNVSSTEEALGELEKIQPGDEVFLLVSQNGQSREVTFRSTTLNAKHLEHLAIFVITQHLDVELDPNSPVVKISVPQVHPKQGKNFWFPDDDLSQHSSMESFFVLGGGYHTSQHSDVWRITTLDEMGALLRIYGLRGGVEYFLTRSANSSQNVEKMVQHFSGNPNIFQSTLWY